MRIGGFIPQTISESYTPVASSGFTGITYATQIGFSDKTGSMVDFYIELSLTTATATSDQIELSLPFLSNSTANKKYIVEFIPTLFSDIPENTLDFFGEIEPGSQVVKLNVKTIYTVSDFTGENGGATFGGKISGRYYI